MLSARLEEQPLFIKLLSGVCHQKSKLGLSSDQATPEALGPRRATVTSLFSIALRSIDPVWRSLVNSISPLA